jgi:TonB family protein
MQQQKPRPGATLQDRAALQTRQSHRLLLALVILVAAIAVLLVTDRGFWFGSNPLILDSDGTEQAAAPRAQPVPSAPKQSQPAPAVAAQKHLPAAKSAAPKSTSPVVTRTVLPPLNVEVVAGNAHGAVHTGANASKLEITQPGTASDTTAVNNAAEREPISPDAIQPEPSYPLLAQHMNVQGSVVLKAVIGADGIIQDLHILSGPAILAAAAQQAVREWRFKPVVRDGQAVETMAKIVVNFSIKVADDSEKTTLAESRADRLIITR